jgi:hypothetical protein
MRALGTFALRTLTFLRWWFGLTYALGAVGAIIAAPFMLANGNGGGVYMLIGAPFLFMLGWVVHPYGGCSG